MKSKTPEYLVYFLEDCLEGDPSFTKKAMFSGYAIYKDKKVFCLYLNDVIYFKVGENNIKDYKKYNSKPFTYTKKDGKITSLSYYELPEEILENKEVLNIWINKSLEVKPRNTNKKEQIRIDKKILEKLLEIPKEKVTTYKILANIFNVHPRKIASVMKYNKNPDIYPCYKVISENGNINGYSGPNGINSKINMLKSDGIVITNGRIGKEFIYNFLEYEKNNRK